ncbi:unnamed protein product [Urochloa humidicola]
MTPRADGVVHACNSSCSPSSNLGSGPVAGLDCSGGRSLKLLAVDEYSDWIPSSSSASIWLCVSNRLLACSSGVCYVQGLHTCMHILGHRCPCMVPSSALWPLPCHDVVLSSMNMHVPPLKMTKGHGTLFLHVVLLLAP